MQRKGKCVHEAVLAVFPGLLSHVGRGLHFLCPGNSSRRHAGLRLLPWPSVPPPLRIFTHLGKKACLYMDGPPILWTFCLVFVHRFRNPQAKKGHLCFLCCTGSLDTLRVGCLVIVSRVTDHSSLQGQEALWDVEALKEVPDNCSSQSA